jgi:hypothetical protein
LQPAGRCPLCGPSGLAKPRGPEAPCRRRSSALQDRDEDVRHRSHSRSQNMRYAIIWFSLAGLLLITFAVSLRGLGERGEGNCRRYRETCERPVRRDVCSELRQACLYKNELGEQGAGNCRRYRETCRGRLQKSPIVSVAEWSGIARHRPAHRPSRRELLT